MRAWAGAWDGAPDVDPTAWLAGVSWSAVAWTALGLYALTVAAFLVLENRSPQSTFAWLFLLLVFPVGGLIVYALFGRSWHAFSRERALTKLVEGSTLGARTARLLAEQPSVLAMLARGAYHSYVPLARMLWQTANAPLTIANRLDILQNAGEKYPRLLSDIRGATRSVHLLYYEWASDAFTEGVGRLLGEKVRQGVEVRLLYDPLGSLTMLSHRHVRWLRSLGVEVHPFAPLYRLHTLGYRNHRKIAVIDGCIGYSGGLNMTEAHLTGPAGFTGWRDTHARVVGEAALVLQAVFATMWFNTTGASLFDERHFPEPPADVPVLPIQVVSAGPDSRWRAIRLSYLALLSLARHHIYIQSPFLILDESLSEALKTAALGGLDVKVMIAPRGGELSPAYRAGMTYALSLARAGVEVWFYQGDYFHAKTVSIDSAVCSIGSANVDIRSFTINYETNLVIYDAPTARRLEADFEADLRKSVPFSVAGYEARGTAGRGFDSLMRLFSPLL